VTVTNHLKNFGISPLLHYLDIETTSTKITAAIASIGVTSVDVTTGDCVGQFFTSCDISGQVERTRDSDTMAFWHDRTKTSQEAYDLTFSARTSLFDGLAELACYLTDTEIMSGGGKIQIVGNGPEFDNSIIDHAYKQLNISTPWHFGGNQSARTLTWIGRAAGLNTKYADEFKGIKHHALDDSMWEAHCGQIALNKACPLLFAPSRVYENGRN